MPVLPEVPSIMVPPGFRSPFRSASSDHGDPDAVLYRASRIQIVCFDVDLGFAVARQTIRRMSGVRPTASKYCGASCRFSLARSKMSRASAVYSCGWAQSVQMPARWQQSTIQKSTLFEESMKRINISSGTMWSRSWAIHGPFALAMWCMFPARRRRTTGGKHRRRGERLHQQTMQVLRNIASALERAGRRSGDVVRTRIYVTRISEWQEIGRAHGERFSARFVRRRQ